MERFFGFLIIGQIFLVVSIIGKPVTDDDDADCDEDFKKFNDLIHTDCQKSSKSFFQIEPVHNVFGNEEELAAEIKTFCEDMGKQIRCILDTIQNLNSLCLTKNSLEYFLYHISDEEVHQLCDNNAEGYKKLIPDGGIETYMYGIQNEDYVNCIENTDSVQHLEKSTHNENCLELAIKRKCLKQFEGDISNNVHVATMKLEVNSRLMAHFECAEME